MEIIISALILALVMAGMVNIFISGKRYVMHSRARMTGGEIGKLFIDPLQIYIRQTPTNNTSLDGWDNGSNANNPLAVNNNTSFPSDPNLYCGNATIVGPQWSNTECTDAGAINRTLNGIVYRAAYRIGRAPDPTNTTDLRKVTADIIWDEPTS